MAEESEAPKLDNTEKLRLAGRRDGQMFFACRDLQSRRRRLFDPERRRAEAGQCEKLRPLAYRRNALRGPRAGLARQSGTRSVASR
ncbi:hypothetical protein B1694_07955 [Geobacillus zalihae]|nr:hypothetical protein B1694_07955 [Geobacillus zalihae]